MRTSLILLVLFTPLGFVAALPAQRPPADLDVLAVERREDIRGRDRLEALFKRTRARFLFEEIAPRALCRALSTLTGDKVNFSCATKAVADGEPISLRIGDATLWNAMAIVQMQTDLQFVYRSGVVFLVPAADVRPVTFLQVYDLRAPTMRLRSFPGPELRLPGPDDEGPLWPEPVETDQTPSGFTAEAVEALIQEHVTPELWGTDRVSLSQTNGVFVVRHTPRGHEQVRALLLQLGLITPPRVQLIDRPAPARPAPGSARPAPGSARIRTSR